MIRQTETRKVRYEMCNKIENIIKEYHIDRSKFYEVAKIQYEEVIRRVYYAFCDYQKYPTVQVSYMWLRIRTTLNKSDIVREDENDWNSYIGNIDGLIPQDEHSTTYYLLVDGSWVYEGELEELKKVLCEYPMEMEDFYLFPKDYSWLICHCDDGGCMCRIWK